MAMVLDPEFGVEVEVELEILERRQTLEPRIS